MAGGWPPTRPDQPHSAQPRCRPLARDGCLRPIGPANQAGQATRTGREALASQPAPTTAPDPAAAPAATSAALAPTALAPTADPCHRAAPRGIGAGPAGPSVASAPTAALELGLAGRKAVPPPVPPSRPVPVRRRRPGAVGALGGRPGRCRPAGTRAWRTRGYRAACRCVPAGAPHVESSAGPAALSGVLPVEDSVRRIAVVSNHWPDLRPARPGERHQLPGRPASTRAIHRCPGQLLAARVVLSSRRRASALARSPAVLFAAFRSDGALAGWHDRPPHDRRPPDRRLPDRRLPDYRAKPNAPRPGT